MRRWRAGKFYKGGELNDLRWQQEEKREGSRGKNRQVFSVGEGRVFNGGGGVEEAYV